MTTHPADLLASTLGRMASLTSGSGLGALSATELVFEPMSGDGRQDIEIHRLFGPAQTGPKGPAAGIVRYLPGASAAPHEHPGYELIYVFDGELRTGETLHGPGSLLVMSPQSRHAPSSDTGCTLLVVWEQPVQLV
jgi:quercetin dioxygenase-like cupin family protein